MKERVAATMVGRIPPMFIIRGREIRIQYITFPIFPE
jgi:hypothetical protein